MQFGVDGLLHLGHEVGAYVVHHELDLRLALEDGIHYPQADRAYESVANVVAIELLFGVVVVQRLGERLLERRQVSAAVGGVLPVYERVVLLSEPVGVGEDDLKILRSGRIYLGVLAEDCDRQRPRLFSHRHGRGRRLGIGVERHGHGDRRCCFKRILPRQ